MFEKNLQGVAAAPQGLEGLRLACVAARGIPVMALGGVTIGNASGLPGGRRGRNRRHSTLRGRRLAEALAANRADGTIYSGIRLNHAECPFEKVLSLPRSASKPAVFLLLKRATGGWPCSLGPPPGHAQDTQTMQTVTPPKEKFDVGVAGLYQVTGAANGNFIREDTTESGGALISFRQPCRPWLGCGATLATPSSMSPTTRTWSRCRAT